jgi:hypothetical protein
MLEYWVMGCWCNGLLGKCFWQKDKKNRRLPLKTSFQYSNVPLFHV